MLDRFAKYLIPPALKVHELCVWNISHMTMTKANWKPVGVVTVIVINFVFQRFAGSGLREKGEHL